MDYILKAAFIVNHHCHKDAGLLFGLSHEEPNQAIQTRDKLVLSTISIIRFHCSAILNL